MIVWKVPIYAVNRVTYRTYCTYNVEIVVIDLHIFNPETKKQKSNFSYSTNTYMQEIILA